MQIGGEEFYEDSPPGGGKSPTETYGTDATALERTFWFEPGTFNDRQRRAKALLGWVRVAEEDDGLGGKRRWLTRGLPHGYPADADADVNPTGDSYVYAVGPIRGEPVGAPAPEGPDIRGRSRYLEFRFHVRYQQLPYDIKADDAVLAEAGPLGFIGFRRPDEGDALRSGWLNTRYVSRYIEDFTRTLQIPQGILRLENPAAPLVPGPQATVGFPFSEGGAVIKYTWHQVPFEAFPKAAIQECLNQLNDNVFDGWDDLTLKFRTWNAKPSRHAFGKRLLDIEYTMEYIPRVSYSGPRTRRGHNAMLAKIGGNLDYYYASSTGTAAGTVPHTTKDFTALFRPTQVAPP